MKASNFFKTTKMFDSFEIIRQCARCGRFDSHEDTCLEIELEARDRLEVALQVSIGLMKRQPKTIARGTK